MAVINVNVLPAGREGSRTSERKGSVYEMVNRKFKISYRVVTNDINDGPQIVLSSGLVPAIGGTYTLGNDTDSLATCVSLECDPTQSPLLWHVTAEYDTDRIVDANVSNPLNLPAEVNWTFNSYERPLVRDLFGVAVLNSSRQPFDPPVMYEDSRPVLSATRNEAVYSSAVALAYQDACNSDVFAGCLPYQCKIKTYTGQKQNDIGITYYKVNYEVEFRREGFYQFILDQGFKDKNGKVFRDPVDNSTPLANPTLMNGKGLSWTVGATTAQAAIGINDTSIQVLTADVTKFPELANNHPTTASLPYPDWYFEIKVESEVMQVQGSTNGGANTTWNVIRGYAGTTPAAHANGIAVALEPYFLRFFPSKVLPFGPLNIPTS